MSILVECEASSDQWESFLNEDIQYEQSLNNSVDILRKCINTGTSTLMSS